MFIFHFTIIEFMYLFWGKKNKHLVLVLVLPTAFVITVVLVNIPLPPPPELPLAPRTSETDNGHAVSRDRK